MPIINKQKHLAKIKIVAIIVFAVMMTASMIAVIFDLLPLLVIAISVAAALSVELYSAKIEKQYDMLVIEKMDKLLEEFQNNFEFITSLSTYGTGFDLRPALRNISLETFYEYLKDIDDSIKQRAEKFSKGV